MKKKSDSFLFEKAVNRSVNVRLLLCKTDKFAYTRLEILSTGRFYQTWNFSFNFEFQAFSFTEILICDICLSIGNITYAKTRETIKTPQTLHSLGFKQQSINVRVRLSKLELRFLVEIFVTFITTQINQFRCS